MNVDLTQSGANLTQEQQEEKLSNFVKYIARILEIPTTEINNDTVLAGRVLTVARVCFQKKIADRDMTVRELRRCIV